MGSSTHIAWCDRTFNPWKGCVKVHAGCKFCYAEHEADIRYSQAEWGSFGTRVKTNASYWKQPYKWAREAVAAQRFNAMKANPAPYRSELVFCASWADVFEDWDGVIRDHAGHILTPSYEPAGWQDRFATMDDMRSDLFTMIDLTPHLTWLLLTKRPENIRRMWPGGYRHNVWLGTSVSDQETADEWMPRLRRCYGLCPMLFLSAEPMLGPIDFRFAPSLEDGSIDSHFKWVIFGGESGWNARPCHEEWLRSGIQQCRVAGIPPFLKQLGQQYYRENQIVQTRHVKGGDILEWPEDLQTQEFPRAIESVNYEDHALPV